MSKKPQITIHYADGRPSETRDMTAEEIAELLPEGSLLENLNETPAKSPLPDTTSDPA